MNIQYRFRGLNNPRQLRGLIERKLDHLTHLIPIGSAQVLLEHQHNVGPPFRASALLSVPGPGIHATAADHTLAAAWLKVVRSLRQQVERRALHQHLRLKGRGECRTMASQWGHAP